LQKIVSTIRFLLLIVPAVFVVGCSSGGDGGSTQSSIPPVPYCDNTVTYSNNVTITGSASYEYRAGGNGNVAGPNPIRHAEIRVTNSAGAIIQCGETDQNGNFSLRLPANNTTATVTVTSRANNNQIKAYVLKNPTQNTHHGISKSVVLDESKSMGNIRARATGSLEGGAFNILDKVLDSNDYLRTATNSCGSTFPCTPFTVAPLVRIYWAKGVDPGQYFNLPPLSFFLPERNELYILGGRFGDVDSSDTDHFDNTIIIHEYGHFIEHNYSITNSPGGQHNGDNILDPRLAWGEAWANFFQAQVTGSPFYLDTYGTPEGDNGIYVNEDLDDGNTDTPTEMGEGNFREFSITRALIDLLDDDSSGDTDGVQVSFEEFWSVFTASSNSFADPTQRFRAVGLFYLLQEGRGSATDWSPIQTAENQIADIINYGNTLSTASAPCGNIAIRAENVPGASPSNNPGRQPEDGTFINSNMFKSNDFYRIDHGGGPLSIQLNYSTSSGSPADLDIYLYRNDYVFGVQQYVVAMSVDKIPNGASSDIELISVPALAASTYMLNVNYNTQDGIKSTANYNLRVNGNTVCPD